MISAEDLIFSHLDLVFGDNTDLRSKCGVKTRYFMEQMTSVSVDNFSHSFKQSGSSYFITTFQFVLMAQNILIQSVDEFC